MINSVDKGSELVHSPRKGTRSNSSRERYLELARLAISGTYLIALAGPEQWAMTKVCSFGAINSLNGWDS